MLFFSSSLTVSLLSSRLQLSSASLPPCVQSATWRQLRFWVIAQWVFWSHLYSMFHMLSPDVSVWSGRRLQQFLMTLMRSGADVRRVKRTDAGAVLSETLRHFLFDLQVEDGLQAVGYTSDDIPSLVRGTIPQVCWRPSPSHPLTPPAELLRLFSSVSALKLLKSSFYFQERVTKLSPRAHTEDDLMGLFEASMKLYWSSTPSNNH